MTDDDLCRTCQWWDGEPEWDIATCRRFPPTHEGRWPDTEATDWCGEWRPRPTPDPPPKPPRCFATWDEIEQGLSRPGVGGVLYRVRLCGAMSGPCPHPTHSGTCLFPLPPTATPTDIRHHYQQERP